jgi:hypothetical protein
MFLMIMDVVMRKSTDGKRRAISWDISEQLEDVEFGDDVYLLFHTFVNMKKKVGTYKPKEVTADY